MREKLLTVLIIISLARLLEKSHKLYVRRNFFSHFPANIGTQHCSIVPKDLFHLHFSDWMSAVFKEQFLLRKYNFHPSLEDKHWYSVQKITFKKVNKTKDKNLRFMVFFEPLMFSVTPKIYNRRRNCEWFYKELVKNHTELAKVEDSQKARLISLIIKASMYLFGIPLKEITGSWWGQSSVTFKISHHYSIKVIG